MHGYTSESGLLVNAEVDSMGGVVDGGVGIGLKTSPRRAAIERAQAALRQEYDVREERRRELEFLEKGGNPLDFKFGNGASVSVQSTSLTAQHPEQIVTSEAKGSFALATSPHGDSVESSGRPGVPAVCEPNSADNLLLFDGDNELIEGERSSIQPGRMNHIPPSEQSFHMDGSQNVKESEDSAFLRPYARRYRSRPSRDGARGRDGKEVMSEMNNTKDQNIPSVSNAKAATSNGDIGSKIVYSDNQLDTNGNGVRALETISSILPEVKLDVKTPKSLRDTQHDQSCHVNPQQIAVDMASGVPDLVGERHLAVSAGFEFPPSETSTRVDNETRSGQLNGFSSIRLDRKSILNEGQNSNAALGTEGLDSECFGTQTSLGVDVNNDNDMCTTRNATSNGNVMEQTSNFEETINLAGGEVVKEMKEPYGVDIKNDTKAVDKTNESKAVDRGLIINTHHDSVYQNHPGNSTTVKVVEDIDTSRCELQKEVKCTSNTEPEGVQQNEHIASEIEGKLDVFLVDYSKPGMENINAGRLGEPMDILNFDHPVMDSSSAPELPNCSGNKPSQLADMAHEDSILEEARIIEAKRKRIAELCGRTLHSENQRKCQWDFVLEEMAWLANDFAQERLWKISAAAQICHQVTFTSRLRLKKQNQCWELQRVAHTLAKAVMQFWCSAEVVSNSDDRVGQNSCKCSLVGSRRVDGNELSKDKIEESYTETNKELGTQYPRQNASIAVVGYAMRFLKYNNSLGPSLQAHAPTTPDRTSDLGIAESSLEEHLAEESLSYLVVSGAMETYRKSIVSHLLEFEKTGSAMHEEVETSAYGAAAEYAYEGNVYDEYEGETSTFSMPGSKSSKFSKKKRKDMMNSYNSRSYEAGADFPHGHCTTGTQQSILIGMRPSRLNVGPIPTKRTRTAPRHRVLSPFGAGATGTIQAQLKTDASSGDTNSCQDDQSPLHGASQMQKSAEVESVGEFEKQLPYYSAEASSMRPKKKNKSKHLASTYDLGWQLDSAVLNEQRDHSKKRLDNHHFECNGTNGLYGQPNAKKPKIAKQFLDNFDNITPMGGGSIPSPVASQMSNLSNTNKIIKLIGGRDRGRKVKASKMSAGQPGSGSPWSLFEDQALVVLVHDMGPNWELVSDVINSTLQFKCIFRKPKECKERHKHLMDRNAGDGADSAEDSGSSQSYPSTLPGIPKGSARQLFQRLQGPMEEDAIKAHFEKIIMIGQKQHYRRSQSDNQDLKQIGPVHNSHAVAVNQVCPNNLNGGVLTPLDLCDATTSSPDVPLGFQGSHASGLASQGSVASMLPTSGVNSTLQGSSGVVLGSNVLSPSGPLNASVRYNAPRTSSLLVDEQQRMQQYSQIQSGRNIQQSSMSVSGPGGLSGTDRSVRMIPGGNAVGMMCGMNRNMPMSRPGFQGMPSSSMLGSGTMLSSSMVGMPSSVGMHSGAGSGPVNSMLRPREALHMMRPGHNPEHQRQMMVPELQMQATQGNSQVIPHFNGLTSAFSNQTTPPPVQPYGGHSQQHHQMSPKQSHALSSPNHPNIQGPNPATGSQNQAYAIRLAKDRHLQQRYFQQQQQQQQFAASNALMPHAQPQPQPPISSSVQNNSQIQSQTSSQPVSLSPVTPSSPMAPLSSQHQQKHHLPQHGISRNPGVSGLTSQMGKQRRQPQQQPFQQSGRHHPNQRQQAQSQQQAKLLKGIGRGNMLVHQNLPIEHCHINGVSVLPGSQTPEKGEQIMHVMQGQGLYSGSSINPIQPSKPLAPPLSSNHPQLQQKLLGPAATLSKPLQQIPPHVDSSSQGQSPPVPPGHTLSSTHQTVPSSVVASNQQQLQPQPHIKQVNQTQSSAQRLLQQNRQVNSELKHKSQTDLAQADQKSVNNASPVVSSTAMPQACNDSTDVIPIVSSSVSPQYKVSESVYDSNMPNVRNTHITNSSRSESLPPISQGLGPRQLSGNFPLHGNNVGVQWQTQLPLQQSVTPPPPSQQQYQHQERQQHEHESPQNLQPQQQSQPQIQLLQAGQGSLYMRPTSSTLE